MARRSGESANASGAGLGCVGLTQALRRGIGMGIPNPAPLPKSAHASGSPGAGVDLAVPDGVVAVTTTTSSTSRASRGSTCSSDAEVRITATIAAALTRAGFADDHLGPLRPADVQVARTASRSVLGFMNDMAATAQYVTARSGGIARLDVFELNALLLRTPYNRDGYVRPIDAVRAI